MAVNVGQRKLQVCLCRRAVAAQQGYFGQVGVGQRQKPGDALIQVLEPLLGSLLCLIELS